MTRSIPRLVGYATVGAGVAAAGYVGLVTGACPLDLGIGRRVRPLGPQLVDMAAPREVVFDVIAQPYLGRAPRALADKLRVLDRGNDMVLAAHFTPLGGRLGLVAQTVETVRFTRPERVDFRLVRGPVPHVVEAFELTEQAGGASTRLVYDGEIGADLWGGGTALVRAGRGALGADGGGLAGWGQGRGRTARGKRRGAPALPLRPAAPTHRLTAGTRRPRSKKSW
jgi:hypothetical protein